MAWPMSLQVALKEWAVVCGALERAEQIVLLRKGGIYESAGEFEVEHRAFLLFPTYLHQNRKMVKEVYQARVDQRQAEPETIVLSSAAVVTDIVQLASRDQMEAIADRHIWTPPLIDMRFNYRPENPLYLLIVRASVLPAPVLIDNTMAYAGCKSWVPLDAEVPAGGSTVVMDDASYENERQMILQRVAGG